MKPDPRPAAGHDMTALDEARLVAMARNGEEAAVRELIRRLNPRLFRVARGVLDSNAEAEDAVQDAYLAAFTRLEQFRGESRFSTWITRITVNAARMRARAARPHQEYDTVDERDEGNSAVVIFLGNSFEPAEAALGRSQVSALLEAAVAALPAELRLVFLLHETEGLGVLAIARTLSLNPITVRTRLYRARKRLRTELEARLSGGFEAIFPFDGARCAHMADRVVAQLKRARHL
ncbi:MAG: RNA polymerase sigma factor [Alphaproteobacteria bacterium]|nr:MAG: RNA polymerase sigma factor [Alphaproteobacteria bacterium]